MLDSIGTLGADSAVQLVAGITGAASLAAFGFASLAGPPRPCWTRNRCMLKWDDASLRHRVPLKAEATAKYGAPYMTAHRAHIHGMLGKLKLAVGNLGTDVVDHTKSKAAINRFGEKVWSNGK